MRGISRPLAELADHAGQVAAGRFATVDDIRPDDYTGTPVGVLFYADAGRTTLCDKVLREKRDILNHESTFANFAGESKMWPWMFPRCGTRTEHSSAALPYTAI